jgi:hypothetical protein
MKRHKSKIKKQFAEYDPELIEEEKRRKAQEASAKLKKEQ